jgi:hypothetical protein
MWVLGEFASAQKMLEATRRLRALGHREIDGHSPYALDELEEAFALPRSRVPLLVLVGGLLGAAAGYVMQWWCNAVDFPINVGGRPFHSTWSFVPITFETGVLGAAFAAFFGLFILLRLPRLHHPIFEVNAFRSASLDSFWISIHTDERKVAEADLRALGAIEVEVVS